MSRGRFVPERSAPKLPETNECGTVASLRSMLRHLQLWCALGPLLWRYYRCRHGRERYIQGTHRPWNIRLKDEEFQKKVRGRYIRILFVTPAFGCGDLRAGRWFGMVPPCCHHPVNANLKKKNDSEKIYSFFILTAEKSKAAHPILSYPIPYLLQISSPPPPPSSHVSGL